MFEDILNYPTSFFAPEITHGNKYRLFYRSYHFLYASPDNNKYDEFNFKESYISDFNTINIREWGTYFQNHVLENDLKYILYKARLGEIDTLIFTVKKPGYPISNSLSDNSILKVSDTRSALDFLYYAGFAKRCEKYATYQPDDWYYDRNKPDTNDPINKKDEITLLSNGGLKQLTNAKSDFVKQRYAFQVLRLYFMAGEYDKCVQFYNAQKSIIESVLNSICYRAKGYLAGAYYKRKDFANANYLYSLIYDQYDTMKISAYFSFHPQEENDWNQTLALAKTSREKAALWQMLGIYDDPLRAMKEIYTLDPKSDLLDLLVVRAVNEEEEKFIYQPGEYGDGYIDSASVIKSKEVNKELVDFLRSVADNGNTAKPYQWDLAAGYLSWASGDDAFEKYLDKAKAEAHGDSLVQDQIRLVQLVGLVNSGKAGDKKFEESFLPEITWLNGNHPKDFRSQAAQDFIKANLTKKYAAIGDTLKAVCLAGELNKQTKGFRRLLDRLLVFMNKPNKTGFEEYALGQLLYGESDILEIEALKPFYNKDFKGALAILGADAGNGPQATYADPFVIHINDCHDCDFLDKKQKTYTKRSFIERMIALENKVKSDPAQVADTYFLLANGCYNMTYYGNSRVLYETKLSRVSDDFFEFHDRSDSSEVDNMEGYFSCKKAEEYYRKALASSKDAEFKAKCYFMIVKCEQNETYNQGNSSGEFSVPEYYDTLKSEYSSAKYYHEIINECEYFRDYLKK